MRKFRKYVLFLTRVSFGFVFLYAGVTKIVDSEWSAAGYLKGAKTFPDFYAWLASPQNIEWVNLANEWGLTLIGAALILGLLMPVVAPAGFALMLLYYFPVLEFPQVGKHSFIVDEHIVYAFLFLTLWVSKAGRYWGIDKKLFKRKD